jgi:RNA recognition motif. (a.k.a. RRM, RBD, or RNP domain)
MRAAMPAHGTPHHSLSPPARPPKPRDAPQQPPPPPPQQQAVAHSALLSDPAVLLVHITRPLPEYALQHEFSKYGTVTAVKLLQEDGCYATVHMEDAVCAAKAASSLDKSQICGMTLTVEVSDNQSTAPSALRARFLSMVRTSSVPHTCNRHSTCHNVCIFMQCAVAPVRAHAAGLYSGRVE